MMWRLATRNFVHRPWRSAFLFLGFGIGVSVMIVLLSIGRAMVAQAEDEKLVGGGDVTVLPEGIDLELLKTGGLGGLFFSIENSRFLDLQLLAAPRLGADIKAVAPQIDSKLLYLTSRAWRQHPVLASGDIPSATQRVGAAPALAAGEWMDDDGDRRWVAPTRAELDDDIDHFHLPPPNVAAPGTWAEWHYFNVLSNDHHRWAFISFILAGDMPNGQWGGRVLITTHGDGLPERRFVANVSPIEVAYSTRGADLQIGKSTVTVTPDGDYRVRARAKEERGAASVVVDLLVTPAPRAYFPGAAIAASDFASGYTVPALRAQATGRLCVNRVCEQFNDAQAYHDHNWGVWRGVTWEWGAARAGRYTVLYGRVQPPDSLSASTPLFVYVVDSLGFLAVFRPGQIQYDDRRTITVNGHPLRVPSRAWLRDVRGTDTLRLMLTVESATATDTRDAGPERGASGERRVLAHPYFVQMKGTAQLDGRVDGTPIAGSGTGFFETYR